MNLTLVRDFIHSLLALVIDENNFIILLYEDDILVVNPNKAQIQELKAQLAREFDVKD